MRRLDKPWTSRELRALTHFFAAALGFYMNHPEQVETASAQDFIRDLNTLVGLSSTVVLVQQELLRPVKTLLNRWWRYQPFYQHPKQIKALASAVVSLAACSSDLMRDVGYPAYSDDWEQALRGCIHHGVSELGLSWPEGMRFWEE